MWKASSFQNLGAATKNARSPLSLLFGFDFSQAWDHVHWKKNASKMSIQMMFPQQHFRSSLSVVSSAPLFFVHQLQWLSDLHGVPQSSHCFEERQWMWFHIIHITSASVWWKLSRFFLFFYLQNNTKCGCSAAYREALQLSINQSPQKLAQSTIW